MRNYILSLITIITTSVSYSQDYKFRKVSKEELLEQNHPIDPDAEAAYLYKSRDTHYTFLSGNFQIVTEVHERIKIYNKDGFSYATKAVFLNTNGGGTGEKVIGLKAYTYVVEDDEIVEHKLGKDAIFNENVTRGLNKKTFTMPNIVEGCVVEFSYKLISPFFFNIDDFSFQSGIPINKLEASFEAPKYFEFKPIYKGYLRVDPKNESKTSNRIGGETVKVTKFNLTNIPALKDEVYVDNINNYRSGLSYELKSISIPGGMYKSYSQDWNDVTKTIYKYNNFGDELDKTGYFEDDLNIILQGVTDENRKIELIFDHVRDKMNWNNYLGYGCNEGVKKAYKENTGNVAEINLILIAMLRYAGINANPVLVSTKSYGIPIFPTNNGFNYVIAAVEGNNSVLLLDATSKYVKPNVIPTRALNWMGRLIRKNGSSVEIDLSAPQISKEITSASIKINEDGAIEGKVRCQYTNHSAYIFRKDNLNTSEDKYLEELENDNSGIEISDYGMKNEKELSKPVTESYSFYKDMGAEIISDKIYFSPMMFFAISENPFKLDKREFPIDFIFPQSERFLITISIPEGYNVESIPKSVSMALPDNLGHFKYDLKQVGEKQIQIVFTNEISVDILPSIYYEALKEYYNQLVLKQTEKAVLSKI